MGLRVRGPVRADPRFRGDARQYLCLRKPAHGPRTHRRGDLLFGGWPACAEGKLIVFCPWPILPGFDRVTARCHPGMADSRNAVAIRWRTRKREESGSDAASFGSGSIKGLISGKSTYPMRLGGFTGDWRSTTTPCSKFQRGGALLSQVAWTWAAGRGRRVRGASIGPGFVPGRKKGVRHRGRHLLHFRDHTGAPLFVGRRHGLRRGRALNNAQVGTPYTPGRWVRPGYIRHAGQQRAGVEGAGAIVEIPSRRRCDTRQS